MAVNYTDVQKTEKYISRTNFDALEMAAVPEGTEFNIVDQIHESDLDSDVLQKLNNNAKINTANTFTAAQTFKKDVTIEGNIIQNGSAYETHAEKLYTKNDMIYTRDGATAALADDAYTGIQAVKYDGTNDGQLVFGKDGVARVGDVGNTQPLATRAEAGAIVDKHLLQWDAAGQTLIDSGKSVSDLEGSGGDVTAAGDNTFTGANTFTDSIVIQGEANTVGLNVSDPSNPTILTRILRNQIFVTDSSNGMKVSLCSAGKLTVQEGSNSAKYQPDKITYNQKDLLFPETESGGTFAITDDLPEANPTAEGTTALTKLKVGDVVYTIPSGGGSGVTSVTTSGSGNAVTTASISGNTLTLTKDSTFLTSHQSLDSCAKLSGDNTFTGSNIFKTQDTNPVVTIKQDESNLTVLSGRRIEIFDSIIGEANKKKYGTSYMGNSIIYRVIDYSEEQSKVNLMKLRFPEKEGANSFLLATTDDIPISSATLSDNNTTLTLVLR